MHPNRMSGVQFCPKKLLEQPQSPQNHTISQSNLQEKGQQDRFYQFQDTLYNTPVQGTAADITKKALGLLPQRLVDARAKIIGTVHDEIILEVP
jgi:DNA polymerase I-like protein with 3'-5' exonuclease and polymerase domains